MAVAREDVPAHRVGALRQPPERRDDIVAAGGAPGLLREELPDRGPHLDRAREHGDGLVEVQPNRRRRLLDPLLELGPGVLEARVCEGGPGEGERN